jgi:hypothetical protein
MNCILTMRLITLNAIVEKVYFYSVFLINELPLDG